MAEQEMAEVQQPLDGQPEVEETEETAVAEGEETAGETEETEGEQEPTEDKPKRLGGWQRKLIKKDQEIEFWRTEALRNRRDPEDDSPTPTTLGPRPNVLTWQGTAEQFQEAEDKWFAAREAKVQAETRRSVAWDLKMERAASAHEDYQEVVGGSDVEFPNAVLEAIRDHPDGAEIVYQLAKDHAEAQKIARMSPQVALIELGKYTARLAQSESAESEEETPKKQSRAPKPPTPVSKPSGANNEPSDSDSYKDWLRKRQAQIKARG